MSLPLFDVLGAPQPAPRAAGVTLADVVEQIRRDTEAARDGWYPGPAFYRERIASFREFAKAFAFTQGTR